MLTQSQHDRVARQCFNTLTRAIQSLPELLKDADPDKAAAIVADLMKAYLASPMADPEPGAALAEVLRRCAQDEEDGQPADPAPSLPGVPTFEHSDLPTPEPNIPTPGPDLPPYEAQILSSPSHTWDDY